MKLIKTTLDIRGTRTDVNVRLCTVEKLASGDHATRTLASTTALAQYQMNRLTRTSSSSAPAKRVMVAPSVSKRFEDAVDFCK